MNIYEIGVHHQTSKVDCILIVLHSIYLGCIK